MVTEETLTASKPWDATNVFRHWYQLQLLSGGFEDEPHSFLALSESTSVQQAGGQKLHAKAIA